MRSDCGGWRWWRHGRDRWEIRCLIEASEAQTKLTEKGGFPSVKNGTG